MNGFIFSGNSPFWVNSSQELDLFCLQVSSFTTEHTENTEEGNKKLQMKVTLRPV
jgi:hypothetical protein